MSRSSLCRVSHDRVAALGMPPLISSWRLRSSGSASSTLQTTRAYHTRHGRPGAGASSSPSRGERRRVPSFPAAVAQTGGPSSASWLAHRLQATSWGADDGLSVGLPFSSPTLQWSSNAGAGPRRDDNDTQEARRASPPALQPQRSATHSPPIPAAATMLLSEALAWSVGQDVADVQDDDIVLDTPAALLPCLVDSKEELRQRQRLRRSSRREEGSAADVDAVVTPEYRDAQHPAARGVGQDVIDLVTDAFTAQREAEVKRRREVLYELTHPNPSDYTYDGKLVPPPPLSFGTITEEARSLGNKMMLGPTYSLVRQAGTRASEEDYSGSVDTTVSPASTIETSIAGPSSCFSQRQRGGRAAAAASLSRPYRSRAREENIFRDHNYFFEVNEVYQEIVLVGRACAGKSSLLNSLLGQNVARTSSSPNTTRKISFYQSVTPDQLQAFHAKEHHNQLVKLPGGGLQLTFVDMPGYGIEGMSDQWRDAAIELTDAYFGVRRSVNTVLYCMDCERGLTKTDIKYFTWLENVQGTFYVVLTKCDSVPHSRVTSVMRQIYALITKNRRKYRKVFPFIIPTSAKDGTNIELLRGLITETSGMIPGDKLRDLLKRKKDVFTQTALLEEANRLDAARQLERAQAREFYQLTRAAPPLTEPQGEAWREGRATGDEDLSSPSLQSSRYVPPSDRSGNAATVEAVEASAHAGSGAVSRTTAAPRRYVVGLDGADGSAAASLFLHDHSPSAAATAPSDSPPTEASAAAQSQRERRERFLAWRRTHPLASVHPMYDAVPPGGGGGAAAAEGSTANRDREGDGRYRLHSGLDSPQAAVAVLDIPGDAAEMEDPAGPDAMRESPSGHESSGDVSGPGPNPSPLSSPGARSSVIGFTPGATGAPVGAVPSSFPSPTPTQTHARQTKNRDGGGGAVTRFLEVLEGFGQQPNIIQSTKQRKKEARWRRRHKGSVGGRGGLLAEDASGRLASYQAGKVCGPALAAVDSAPETRQATWRAEKLRELITKENPEAPWLAVHQLRQKLQARKEDAALSGMRKKEVAAYVRDAGRVTESFEKFEGEVTTAKYMNEVRQAPTLRSQQQMHLNATAKINYRSMPPGLLKRYGEKESYWPTPQVLGRAQDESHKP